MLCPEYASGDAADVFRADGRNLRFGNTERRDCLWALRRGFGGRKIAPPPVPMAVVDAYHDLVLGLWRLPASADDPVVHEP